jgi:hypothetical protein
VQDQPASSSIPSVITVKQRLLIIINNDDDDGSLPSSIKHFNLLARSIDSLQTDETPNSSN